MVNLRLWLGLIALCIGVVLVFNLSSLFPYSYGPETAAQIYSKIIIEIVIAVLVFGGLTVMILSVRKDTDKLKPIK